MAIADRLFTTLSYHPRCVLSPAMGIPVRIRTSERRNGTAPVPKKINLDRATHNVVILLVDEHLSADTAWRKYAREIADDVLQLQPSGRHLVLPILFPNASPDLGNTQAIDMRTDVPAGERLPLLTLKVMAEICRLLNPTPRGGAGDLKLSPEAVELFISHAKIDGESDARELLETINTIGLQAFFDAAYRLGL